MKTAWRQAQSLKRKVDSSRLHLVKQAWRSSRWSQLFHPRFLFNWLVLSRLYPSFVIVPATGRSCEGWGERARHLVSVYVSSELASFNS